MSTRKYLFVLLACLICILPASGLVQSLGSAGTLSGTVTDPAGAVIEGATRCYSKFSHRLQAHCNDRCDGHFSF